MKPIGNVDEKDVDAAASETMRTRLSKDSGKAFP